MQCVLHCDVTVFVFHITVSLRRAVIFPLVSLLMLYIGLVMCALGHVKTRPLRAHRQLCILVSGVVYISAGQWKLESRPTCIMYLYLHGTASVSPGVPRLVSVASHNLLPI